MNTPLLRGLVVVLCVLGNLRTATADRPSNVRLLAVEPTMFFVRTGEGLCQVAEATIENRGTPVDGRLEIRLPAAKATAELGRLAQGRSTVQFRLPEVREPVAVEFVLLASGVAQDRRTVSWQPQRHWEVCFVPITHHDLGYTDTLENVLRNYVGFYDDVLRFCDQTQDWPAESQYRYTVEASWSVQHFLRARPKETAQKLARYAREGRIDVSALYGNPVGALHSHEGLVRLLYPSFRLERELGVPIRTAAITDVPGLSWGVASVLAGSGVKYFFAGLPTYFQWGTIGVHDFWDEAAVMPRGRPDAFRWQGPDGNSVLAYYQGGYGHFTAGTGPHSYEEIRKHLPAKLVAIQRQGSPLGVVRFIHNGVDNFPPAVEISHIVREWNSRWAYPRLIVATNTMFFERLARQAPEPRVLRGELPDTDYVVGAASTPHETGLNRITHDRLHAAEKMATLAAQLAGYPRRADSTFWITTHTQYPDVTRALGEAYENMLLFDEHTWGMAHSIGPQQQWNWSDKSRYAYKAAGIADSILAGSVDAIAEQIGLDQPGRHLVVFNALSIPRSDVVRLPAKARGYGQFIPLDSPFTLVDTDTGRTVAHQIVRLDSPQAAVPYAAERYARGQFSSQELDELVFVAEDVPPLGWKTYRMASGTPASTAAVAAGSALENRWFRIVVDPQSGGVDSVYDKQSSRELIDRAAPHKLNQLVIRHVRDGRLECPVHATVRPGQSGPVYRSMVMTSSVAGCPQVTQEVILYDKLARIDLANRVLKDSTPHLEAYFAFPFRVERPEFHYEGSASVIRPLVDQFPGSNSNYYAVQHWADVGDGQLGIALAGIESHLLEFGGLWPCYVSQAHHGVTPPDFGRPFLRSGQIDKGHMYAFVLDANFRTNFPPLEQADLLYRYAIATHRGSWREGRPRDFGWAVGNPLVAVCVSGKRPGPLEKRMSFCRVEPENAFVLTLKRAEDGVGLIVRLAETAGHATTATLTCPRLKISRARLTNLVEQNQAELAHTGQQVTASLKPFGMTTLRIETSQ
jgi:hypothetical protein